MQHVVEHLNLIPQESRDCDFSRVKHWYLDERWAFCQAWRILRRTARLTLAVAAACRASYLRQTIVFSDYLAPEMNALLAKRCRNVAGRVKALCEYKGTIQDVVPQVQQVGGSPVCPQPSCLAA